MFIRQQMAILREGAWKQCGIEQPGGVFQGNKFHGFAMFGGCPFFRDEPADHGNVLADMLAHVCGGRQREVLKGCGIER